MSIFYSTIKSISVSDHAVSAFGFDAINAVVESHSWGQVVNIPTGENAGWYDVHSVHGDTKFIAA